MTEAEDEAPAKDRSFRVGDHVYVAPPYSQRPAGDPYLIARIVNLPPTEPGEVPKARVAYYLRRRDVTNRLLADHRVVFATFMAGLVPLSHIRRKCYVMHRDYLEDPEAFKREDDSFVFFQIYDRFMHKPFDLIPSSQVMNAPDDVLAHLKAGYEFVCTEVGSTAQLCDAMQGCVSCHAHAAKEQSVTCAVCSLTWHLQCLDPPLLKKPALGWHWSCIKCTMAREEEEEDEDDEEAVVTAVRGPRAVAPKASKNFEAFRQKKKLDWKMKGQAVEPQLDVNKWKMTNGWPYRYFGQHVDQRKTLDPHDPIWPRASTRVGQRFQQLNIPGEESEAPVVRKPAPKRGFKRKTMTEESPLEEERGGEQACTPVWTAATNDRYTDDQLDEYIRSVKETQIYRQHGVVDVLEWALKLLAEMSVEAALNKVSQATSGDLSGYASVANWTATDRNNFKRNIENYNDELLDFRRNLSRKTMPQIVHFYYREEGYKRQYLSYEDPLAKDKLIATEITHADDQEEDDSVEASSLAGSPPPTATRKSKRICAFCSAEDSDRWYKCPDNLGEPTLARKGKTLCHSCAIQWRHYGNPGPALSAAEVEYRAAKDRFKKRPLDKAAETSTTLASQTRSPSPQPSDATVSEHVSRNHVEATQEHKTRDVLADKPAQRVKSCVICKRPEPKQSNFTCSSCGLTVHSGCYGIAYAPAKGKYLCDMCDSRDPDAGDKAPTCTLCPVPSTGEAHMKNGMDALKRTDDAENIHLICAIWHYEISFRDTFALDIGEGVKTMHPSKLDKHCSLCRASGTGACLKCDLCDAVFHVSCAWTAGYRFAFEILPVIEERSQDVPICRFKTEEGLMRPIIICKGHGYNPTRQLYDAGSKDKKGLTAIMTYASAYKGLDILSSFPVLLETRKREQLVHGLDPEASTAMEGFPTDLNDIASMFGTKQPRVPKVKVARKRKALPTNQEQAADSADEEVPATQNPEASSSAMKPATSNNTANTSAATSYDSDDKPKRKRQRRKRLSSEEAELRAALESLSEDEVMPSASTSRSRQSTRDVRSVKKADILASTAEGATIPLPIASNSATVGEASTQTLPHMHPPSVPPAKATATNGSSHDDFSDRQDRLLSAPGYSTSLVNPSHIDSGQPAAPRDTAHVSASVHPKPMLPVEAPSVSPVAPAYVAPPARVLPYYSTTPSSMDTVPNSVPQPRLPARAGHAFSDGQPRTTPTYNQSFHISHPHSHFPSSGISSSATNNPVKESSRSPVLPSHTAISLNQTRTA